ncbi:putative disease resistance protein RPP13-like [Capsicum annuum]|nr:putative disease resistance protein RPP13-like [Capsicum annuum]KAF3677303.1 putative disease resistance protein RPP13-like [Capsicum annuum]
MISSIDHFSNPKPSERRRRRREASLFSCLTYHVDENGSRVIITKRKEDVAERADNKGFVHKLRYLSQEESWDLFCRKLLDVRAMVSTMERLAMDMVGKCGGLPLAIDVLSGLLSHKWGLEEWEKVKAHLWRQIKDDCIEISCILSLSYNDLPTALNQCFLYFGIFLEDQVVEAENNTIVAGRGFHTKRIHDLLWDLAVQKALELQNLCLNERIDKLPLSDQFPSSITIMVLYYSELMEDPMPILGISPNLRNLDLVAAYEGKEITCNDNNFCQLEFLCVDNLENLERWHLATSAMPLIKGLAIRSCPKLNEILRRMKDVLRTHL